MGSPDVLLCCLAASRLSSYVLDYGIVHLRSLQVFSYVIGGSDEPPTLDVDDNNSRDRE